MSAKTNDQIKELADDHWVWIFGLIDTIDGKITMETVEYLYKTGIYHGYKHAIDDIGEKK